MKVPLLLARKESAELLLSGRGLGWLLAMSAVLSVFGLLLVSDTELSLLDNAQVVYYMAGTVTALGAILGVVLGSDAIAGERERGTLVPLLLTPMSRAEILLGKIGGQSAAWAVMYLIALPYLWAVGASGQNLITAVVILGWLGTPVVLGFGFLAIGLSSRLALARTSLLTALIFLLLSASPLLLGPGLRQSVVGKAFDAINPFSAAVNAYDLAIIDSTALAGQWPYFLVTLAWLGLMALFAAGGVRRVQR